DALATLKSVLGGALPLEPLAAFLMRNEDWADEPNLAALTARLMGFLGLSDSELGTLTKTDPLTVPLLEPPEWTSDAVTARFPIASGPSSPGSGGANPPSLADLVNLWREQTGYPTQHDDQQQAARADLAAMLTEPALDDALAEPALFELSQFRRLAGNTYGGTGNQAQINVFLSKEEDAVSKLVKTIKHLLYGPGGEAQRLDEVIPDGLERRIPGFSEALATKCLA